MRTQMTSVVGMVGIIGSLIVSTTAIGWAAAPKVTLARDGQAATIYVVDPEGRLMGDRAEKSRPPRVAQRSIEDLAQSLGKLSGGTFKVEAIEAYPGAGKSGIYVGKDKDLKIEGVDGGKEQYAVRTTAGGQLLIAGADERGVSDGIYALLGKLGCRWYYPGDLWAVTPPVQKTLEIAVDEIGGPDFYIQRRVWPGHGLHTPTTVKELGDWQRRNGIAQPFGVENSHSWIGLDEKADFQTHPEWFALVNGQRKTSKPCYANPEVIAKAIKYALNHFEKNPESEMVSVSAPDGLGFCTCELCQKQARVTELRDIGGGVWFGTNPDGQEVSVASETIFNMANQVAKAVAAKYPTKRVGILGYSAYSHPPSFKLEPSIYVEVTAGYKRTPLTAEQQREGFGRVASALGVYEYFDVEQWAWDQPGKAKAAQLEKVQAAIRTYYENNFRSLSGESSDNFGPNGVGYYAITRLLWDSKQDIRKIEEEFYTNAFGPAAEPIKRLYRRWESDPKHDAPALKLAYADLAEAAKLTSGQSAYHDRVDRLRMYAHFLKLWMQPPTDHEPTQKNSVAWAKTHDTPEQKQKIAELGMWASRLIDTHMIHWAYNRYLLSGAQAMGMDVSEWKGTGKIPTAQEVEEVFQKDLAELQQATE